MSHLEQTEQISVCQSRHFTRAGGFLLVQAGLISDLLQCPLRHDALHAKTSFPLRKYACGVNLFVRHEGEKRTYSSDETAMMVSSKLISVQTAVLAIASSSPSSFNIAGQCCSCVAKLKQT